MENSITPFAFGDNMIRVHQDENGNPWFVARDVCRVLEIENNRDAIVGLDDDERITVSNPDGNPRAGIPHQYTLVSESGLYALVFRSRKPGAKAFSRWVRAEVLPSIRRTGSYAMPRVQQVGRLPLPDTMPAEALSLRPSMRQRLWQDALQTARLDGGDSDAVREWFAFLCRMMAAERPRSDVQQRVREFVEQCLESVKGCHTPVSRIYDAFILWWKQHEDTRDMPGIKTVSTIVSEYFRRYKASRMMFKNCRLILR